MTLNQKTIRTHDPMNPLETKPLETIKTPDQMNPLETELSKLMTHELPMN